jgi:phage gp46-like protein
MSQNITWSLDPTIGDYVMGTDGNPVQDTSLLTPSYIRLKTQRTKWLYAPDNTFGADFYLIQKNHSGSDTDTLQSVAQRALQPCIDDGRASAIAVTNAGQSLYESDLSVIITDVIGQPVAIPLDSIGI